VTRSPALFRRLRRHLSRFLARPAARPAAALADDVVTVTVRRIDRRPVDAVIDALEGLAARGHMTPAIGRALARALRDGGHVFEMDAEPDPAGGALDYVARMRPGQVLRDALAACRTARAHRHRLDRWILVHGRYPFDVDGSARAPP